LKESLASLKRVGQLAAGLLLLADVGLASFGAVIGAPVITTLRCQSPIGPQAEIKSR